MNSMIRLLHDSQKTSARMQKIGAICKEHLCMTLSSGQNIFSFISPQTGVCALELDELHDRKEVSFSYLILINEQIVFQRTMEPMSDSICPSLVKLLLKQGDTVVIRLVSGMVHFTDIFLHTDLNDVMMHYLEPMEIGLCFPRPSYTDREADLAMMCKIRDDFSDLKHFTPSIGIEVKYMQLSNTQLAEQVAYILGLAQEAGVNLIFNFNSWWDGTPLGRDGKGGYFSDMEYHQIVYDPMTGKKLLSVPNIWKNTPWYTMNHDHLNQVRKARLSSTLDILGEYTASLALKDGYLPTVRILIDNEPTYWAEFAYSSSPEAGGDFNEHAIRAAAKDDVDLTPVGQLKSDQKLWLLRNLCTYMTDISKVYHTCASSEYAVVSHNQTSYGNHHLTENVMTHVQAYSGHPYADERHMRHEEHVNPYTRLGIETCGHQDERALSYLPATGRYAQVNAERCCYTDPAFHRQFYAHGAFSDIIFNFYYDTDLAHLHVLDDMDKEIMPQQVYGIEIMRFLAYNGHLDDDCVVSARNIEIGPLRERRILRPASLGEGYITFCLGEASLYPHGGWVELKGLVRPLNGSISAAFGTTPDTFSFCEFLPEWDADHQIIPLRISLDSVLSQVSEKDVLYLRLTFNNLYYEDWAQMNAIWEVRGVAAFEDFHPEGTLGLTLPESRALSLLISYRTDCTRLLEQYPMLPITKEEDFKTQYLDLMHKISVHCTEKFLICGSGYLEKYNLHVDSCDSTIRLELREETDGIIAALYGTHGTQLSFSMDGHSLRAVKLSHNKYLLQKGAPSASSGMLTLSISEEIMAVQTFEGTFLSYDAKKSQIEVSTHSSEWDYQPVLQFTCPQDVPVTLMPSEVAGDMLDHISTNPYTPAAILNARIDSTPTIFSLNPGDQVILQLLGGQITRLHAIRGLARGRILDIQPLSMEAPMHNAFLTIETAPGKTSSFELGMNTHLNYTRAHGENPIFLGDLDLGLSVNNIVLISFEPETLGDRPYRALEITLV